MTPRYIQWTIPSLLYQTRKNNFFQAWEGFQLLIPRVGGGEFFQMRGGGGSKLFQGGVRGS